VLSSENIEHRIEKPFNVKGTIQFWKKMFLNGTIPCPNTTYCQAFLNINFSGFVHRRQDTFNSAEEARPQGLRQGLKEGRPTSIFFCRKNAEDEDEHSNSLT
jgi:hypothetical protein